MGEGTAEGGKVVIVLVCGDRNWTDHEAIEARLKRLPKDTVIIEGGARGADYLAHTVAVDLGMQVWTIKADWDKYGKSAGPIRNRQMLGKKPDLVIAFHPDLSKSKGTADTVREAMRRKIQVEVINK